MVKKIVSSILIIAILMSMPVTFVTASALTPANISYGMFKLSAGEEDTTLYSYEYTRDYEGNITGVDVKFEQARNTRTDIIKYANFEGEEAKFVHNRLLIALEDCGVNSQGEDVGCGMRVSHFIGKSWTRQINFGPKTTSIFDGDNAARGYAFSQTITVSTTENPYYSVYDWIWDCENGLEFIFIDGALAAYATNAAIDGKFYGFSLEKMDEKFDVGDVFSAKFDPNCPGHTIYKDTQDFKVTLDDVIKAANIKNCDYDSHKTLIEARMKTKADSTHQQSEVYDVKGTGLVIQAEDVYYNPCYKLRSDRLASGTKAVSSDGYFPTLPGAGEPPHMKFNFTVDETATYNIWLRGFASSSKCDELYVGVNDDDYANCKVIRETKNYEWNSVKVVKLQKGEINTLKIKVKEGANYIDCFLITKITSFKPSGRFGNLPEKYSEDSLKLDGYRYAVPPVNPPANEHPRVLFRKGDIPKIKKNMESEQCKEAKDYYDMRLAETVDTDWTSYSCANIQRIQVNALEYALYGDKQRADAAKAGIMSFLSHNDIIGSTSTTDNTTRNGGYILYTAALVYDWCYDVFTEEEKKELISGCVAIAMSMEIGWPPNGDGVITSHSCEAQLYRDLLALAIATYDERPDLWRHIGGRYYDELVEPRQFFLSSMFQGGSYGQYREIWSTWSYLLIKGMGEEPPNDLAALVDMNRWVLYYRRPDGQTLRDGDEAQDSNYRMWKYWAAYPQYLMNLVSLSEDKYLKYEIARRAKNFNVFNADNTYNSPVEWLIINNPEEEPAKSFDGLPLSKYFGGNNGYLLARTGWDDGVESDDVVAEMKIGAYQTIGHQHLDAGHFQIYYKGILASDSGVYQGALSSASSNGGTAYWSVHTNQYGTKTVAHNCILVFDPNECDLSSTKRGTINDGGQRIPNNGDQLVYMDYLEKYDARTSYVENVEIDPQNTQKPSYSYIKGDLTKAYTDKVKEYKRSFMFLNLDNSEVPAAMIVFDKITSSDPSFKKTWLLHGLEEPEINGNRTVFRRTYRSNIENYGYNGKLTVDSLLPEDNTITKIGGEGMWSYVNGTDYTGYPLDSHTDEGNSWRIELSPKQAQNQDYFLNVLQVSDNDKENYMPVSMINAEKFYGTVISDRVVLFSKSGEAESETFTFEAPEGKNYRYTVCDIEEGEYKITTDDGEQAAFATKEGGVLSFTANGGAVTVEKTGENADNQGVEDLAQTPENNKVSVRINDVFVYTSKPVVLQDGAVMTDTELVSRYMDADVALNGDTVEISKAGVLAKFTDGSDIVNINGADNQMYVAAQKTENGWYLPLRAVTEALNGSISWDKYANTVFVTKAKPNYALPDGYAKVASVTPDGGAVDQGHTAQDIADCDYSTVWTAEGVGRYVTIELESVSTLSGIEISFNPHVRNPRNAEFAVSVSTDGINYSTVYSGKSDGSVEEGTWEKFEFDKPYTAKYVRYIGNGSNVNKWNAVKELRLKLK